MSPCLSYFQNHSDAPGHVKGGCGPALGPMGQPLLLSLAPGPLTSPQLTAHSQEAGRSHRYPSPTRDWSRSSGCHLLLLSLCAHSWTPRSSSSFRAKIYGAQAEEDLVLADSSWTSLLSLGVDFQNDLDSCDSHEPLASLLKDTWRDGGRCKGAKQTGLRKTSWVTRTIYEMGKKRLGEPCQSRKGKPHLLPTFKIHQLKNWNGGSSPTFSQFSGNVISHPERCHTSCLTLCPE